MSRGNTSRNEDETEQKKFFFITSIHSEFLSFTADSDICYRTSTSTGQNSRIHLYDSILSSEVNTRQLVWVGGIEREKDEEKCEHKTRLAIISSGSITTAQPSDVDFDSHIHIDTRHRGKMCEMEKREEEKKIKSLFFAYCIATSESKKQLISLLRTFNTLPPPAEENKVEYKKKSFPVESSQSVWRRWKVCVFCLFVRFKFRFFHIFFLSLQTSSIHLHSINFWSDYQVPPMKFFPTLSISMLFLLNLLIVEFSTAHLIADFAALWGNFSYQKSIKKLEMRKCEFLICVSRMFCYFIIAVCWIEILYQISSKIFLCVFFSSLLMLFHSIKKYAKWLD